jgi:hypothetical protein
VLAKSRDVAAWCLHEGSPGTQDSELVAEKQRAPRPRPQGRRGPRRPSPIQGGRLTSPSFQRTRPRRRRAGEFPPPRDSGRTRRASPPGKRSFARGKSLWAPGLTSDPRRKTIPAAKSPVPRRKRVFAPEKGLSLGIQPSKAGKNPFGSGSGLDPAAKGFFRRGKAFSSKEKGFCSELRGFSGANCSRGDLKAPNSELQGFSAAKEREVLLLTFSRDKRPFAGPKEQLAGLKTFYPQRFARLEMGVDRRRRRGYIPITSRDLPLVSAGLRRTVSVSPSDRWPEDLARAISRIGAVL